MAQTKAQEAAKYRNKIVKKKCVECGREFEEKRHCRGVCAICKPIRHKRAHPPTYKTCERCGQVFGPVDRYSRQYCSRTCKGAASQGRPTSKRGKQYPHTRRAETRICPGCGGEFRGVKDTKRERQYYCSPNCYRKCRRTSKFEIAVMDMLEASGLKVERQAKRGRWSFDGAVIGTSILVEADGVFWHSSVRVKERDERKDRWAAGQGYAVIRVPELAFKHSPLDAIDVILRRAEAEGLTVERIDG